MPLSVHVRDHPISGLYVDDGARYRVQPRVIALHKERVEYVWIFKRYYIVIQWNEANMKTFHLNIANNPFLFQYHVTHMQLTRYNQQSVLSQFSSSFIVVNVCSNLSHDMNFRTHNVNTLITSPQYLFMFQLVDFINFL